VREFSSNIKLQDGNHILESCIKFSIKNNKFHNADGPALEYPDGTKSYYFNGDLCRCEKPDGTIIYYSNGSIHRVDGPAIQCTDPQEDRYLIRGKLHRIDGPAIIEYQNKKIKKERFFLLDKEYSYIEWERLKKLVYFQ